MEVEADSMNTRIAIMFLMLVIFLSGCAKKPEAAKQAQAQQELKRRNVAFDSGTFVKESFDGKNDDVALFLDAGMSPNTKGSMNYVEEKSEEATFTDFTPLHAAALKGNAALVELLLSRGADVNAACTSTSKSYTYRKGTALHLAAREGHTDVVKVLLQHGADVNARVNDEITPLALAKDAGNQEIVKMLKEKGAAE